jgi:anhydro-N-acetylmuramic acid kinase
MNVIGLMSGTSADGIDAALVTFEGDAFRLVAFHQNPYPPELRKRILAVSSPGTSRLEDVARLHFLLGERFAEAAHAVAGVAGMPMERIDLIGSHGQTILHLPEAVPEGDLVLRATLQIGEPSVIAERTGVTTVADFRPRDIAAGGQGAPLTPYFHYQLLRHPVQARAALNVGGIANMTYVPPGAGPEAVVAFDTGPGNMVIDGLVERITGGAQTMDLGGERARRGRAHPELLDALLADPYFSQAPPKTTGRERFGGAYIDALLSRGRALGISDDDLIATATALTARSVGAAVRNFLGTRAPLAEIVVGGGGARNLALLEALARAIPGAKISTFDAHGVPAEALEAVIFAALARLTILNVPNNIPSATGASHPVVLGKIVPGPRGIPRL